MSFKEVEQLQSMGHSREEALEIALAKELSKKHSTEPQQKWCTFLQEWYTPDPPEEGRPLGNAEVVGWISLAALTLAISFMLVFVL